MTTKDLFAQTYTALSANKLRTGLTVLGIVIGISSVIIMVSIGQGAKVNIEKSIQSVGSNLISVVGGQQRGFGPVSGGRGGGKILTMKDVAVVEKVSGLTAVSAEVQGRYQIVAKGKNTNTTVVGTLPTYTSIRSLNIASGNFFDDSDVSRSTRVVVLGPSARDDLFGEGVDDSEVIGQSVRIKNMPFKVIGIVEAKGGSGFNNPDDMMYIPLSAAQHYLSGDEYVNSISASAESSSGINDAKTGITEALLSSRNIADSSAADFSVMTQADILSTASTITDTFTLLLAAIAAISLIVGGIGIMNMMLTSVSERTKEIGLRKAIGATNGDIYKQFLAEAVVLTGIGGLIGILLGVGVALLLSLSGILATSLSIMSLILSVTVSAVIGLVFGFYPARSAAKLSPIRALRFD